MMVTGHVHSAGTAPSRAVPGALLRQALIALVAFLTVVDLFATQAILPSLASAYGVSPAAMGTAVNASTMGMAAAGILAALFSRRIGRRRGIVASLALLSIPTALLAGAPGLGTLTALRIGTCWTDSSGRRNEALVVALEHWVVATPMAEPAQWLELPLVLERCRPRPQHLADHLSGRPSAPGRSP